MQLAVVGSLRVLEHLLVVRTAKVELLGSPHVEVVSRDGEEQDAEEQNGQLKHSSQVGDKVDEAIAFDGVGFLGVTPLKAETQHDLVRACIHEPLHATLLNGGKAEGALFIRSEGLAKLRHEVLLDLNHLPLPYLIYDLLGANGLVELVQFRLFDRIEREAAIHHPSGELEVLKIRHLIDRTARAQAGLLDDLKFESCHGFGTRVTLNDGIAVTESRAKALDVLSDLASLQVERFEARLAIDFVINVSNESQIHEAGLRLDDLLCVAFDDLDRHS